MRMPSKVNTFADTPVALFVPILEMLQEADMTPQELLEEVRDDLPEMSIFFDALNCLYVLGRIEIPEGTEVLRYVEKN